MIPRRRSQRARSGSAGFTLVELLVVISIMSILASMVMFAMRSSQEAAKAAKTKATIAKLHNLIMSRWDSYKTRRVPVDPEAVALASKLDPRDPKVLAHIRLNALRELMVLEMPERANDVNYTPKWLRDIPALSKAYRDRWNAKRPSVGDDDYEQAECLYMIVTVGLAEEGGREQFAENEIGDADGDGLPEFHDGWGHPIRFLRFAPGFCQPRGVRSDLQSGDRVQDHDPFDTRRVDSKAFALYPLIYSVGPDGMPGIAADFRDEKTGKTHVYAGDPYSPLGDPPGSTYAGQPVPSKPDPGATPELDTHLDNIHNHLIGAR
ncbi:MAG: type II secretion system protein [Pirellulales bacterium]